MAKAASARTPVSIKRQKAVRGQRNWPASTELVVEEAPEGVLLKAPPVFPPTRFEDVSGMLRNESGAGRVLTVKEMDEAIQIEARRRAHD